MKLEEKIKTILEEKELQRNSQKASLSKRFPTLASSFRNLKELKRSIRNNLDLSLSKSYTENDLEFRVHSHQSLLMRKLGDSDTRLQKNKITNLKIASENINNLMLKPGQSFSFWFLVGRPSESRSYVNGMFLSKGRVIEGIGGGLCQLSNLLYWMFLHSDLTITERHHHSHDVFPDSGRVLPFGSGATIMHNYVDLKVKNNTDSTFQVKVWLTNHHLKGEIRSDKKQKNKYHVIEKNHKFISSRTRLIDTMKFIERIKII